MTLNPWYEILFLFTQDSIVYNEFLSKWKSENSICDLCCNLYRKLKSERESMIVELEKVFGSGVELEGLEKESVDGESSNDTAAIVLGVMLALSLITLITVGVVVFIK